MDARVWLRGVWMVGVVLIAVANWPRDGIPARGTVLPTLENEPEQHAIEREAFTATVGGIEYTVKPLYEYEIWGLVVSRYDTAVWYDFSHKQWNDKLNVADVCLVFGDNIRTEAYRNVRYSSGEFTCCWETPSQEAFEAFWPADLSNNHLLTDKPALTRALRGAKLGDQIRIKGQLVEYSHHEGFEFKRGTSAVRTDTGDGACETIWVEEFEVLKPGPPTLRWLGWFGALLVGGTLVRWLLSPLRVR